MHQQKQRIVAKWLGLNLKLNYSEIKLFINADFKGYVCRPEKVKMNLADSVEYLDGKKQKIIFGAKTISYLDTRLENCGYESDKFIKFCKN